MKEVVHLLNSFDNWRVMMAFHRLRQLSGGSWMSAPWSKYGTWRTSGEKMSQMNQEWNFQRKNVNEKLSRALFDHKNLGYHFFGSTSAIIFIIIIFCGPALLKVTITNGRNQKENMGEEIVDLVFHLAGAASVCVTNGPHRRWQTRTLKNRVECYHYMAPHTARERVQQHLFIFETMRMTADPDGVTHIFLF